CRGGSDANLRTVELAVYTVAVQRTNSEDVGALFEGHLNAVASATYDVSDYFEGDLVTFEDREWRIENQRYEVTNCGSHSVGENSAVCAADRNVREVAVRS